MSPDKAPNRNPGGDPGEHPLSVLLFSWMRSPGFFRALMGVLAVIGFTLAALDAVFSGRTPFGIQGAPGFFGMFGFGAVVLTVLGGWPFGRMMRRPERYYDIRSGEAGRDR